MESASQAYSALQNYANTRPQATDYINQANNQYNVQGAQGQVSNLQGLVSNLQNAAAAVDPSVTGRTSGTFTTEAQRQALVNREQQPILTNLGQQQTGLSNAQQNLSTSENLANQMASALMQGDAQKYQSLKDQYDAANSYEQFQAQQKQAAAAAAEQIREFNADLAEKKREANLSASSGGLDLSSLFGGGGAGPAVNAAATPKKLPNLQKAQANSAIADANVAIQKFMGSANSVLSDFKATLQSAVRGNVADQAKVAAYFNNDKYKLFSNSYKSTVQQLLDTKNRKGSLANPANLGNFLVSQLPTSVKQQPINNALKYTPVGAYVNLLSRL